MNDSLDHPACHRVQVEVLRFLGEPVGMKIVAMMKKTAFILEIFLSFLT